MPKYKVKVLRVQGINKNTYKAGDIVTEQNFPEGNAEQLHKLGYLELAETKAETAKRLKAEAEADAKAKAEADAKAEKQAKKEAGSENNN